MSHGHFREVCCHGKVVRQCRCMGPKTTRHLDHCPHMPQCESTPYVSSPLDPVVDCESASAQGPAKPLPIPEDDLWSTDHYDKAEEMIEKEIALRARVLKLLRGIAENAKALELECDPVSPWAFLDDDQRQEITALIRELQ